MYVSSPQHANVGLEHGHDHIVIQPHVAHGLPHSIFKLIQFVQDLRTREHMHTHTRYTCLSASQPSSEANIFFLEQTTNITTIEWHITSANSVRTAAQNTVDASWEYSLHRALKILNIGARGNLSADVLLCLLGGLQGANPMTVQWTLDPIGLYRFGWYLIGVF